jgi:hypothetical protein
MTFTIFAAAHDAGAQVGAPAACTTEPRQLFCVSDSATPPNFVGVIINVNQGKATPTREQKQL